MHILPPTPHLLAQPASPLLLYDGLCALCDGAVQLVLRHDRTGTMRFAPLQGATASAVYAQHPHLASIDSLILIDEGGVHVRSAAALRLCRYLGGAWRLFTVCALIPTPIRDLAYRTIARTRYRLFGRRSHCRVPTPAMRDRFLP